MKAWFILEGGLCLYASDVHASYFYSLALSLLAEILSNDNWNSNSLLPIADDDDHLLRGHHTA